VLSLLLLAARVLEQADFIHVPTRFKLNLQIAMNNESYYDRTAKLNQPIIAFSLMVTTEGLYSL